MLIKIGNFEYTEVWDGVLYKNLSDYPNITDWEVRTLIEFIDYEKSNGREYKIECNDKKVLNVINQKLSEQNKYRNVPPPQLITECTACPRRKGCVTEFVCHTTSPQNAIRIFQSGKILSASLASGVPCEQLVSEKRNAANDPADYFNYVMLAWGNCQSGDRLVMERKLGRFPTETDLSTEFTPGIRFFFRYDDLVKHPQRVFDGVLPFRIKDEIDLFKWVYAIVIPSELRQEMQCAVPSSLQNKVLYIENDCKDIWEWAEKVYTAVENL